MCCEMILLNLHVISVVITLPLLLIIKVIGEIENNLQFDFEKLNFNFQ